MLTKRNHVFFAPDDGGGSGGADPQKKVPAPVTEPEKKDSEAKVEDTPPVGGETELEKARKELKALQDKQAEQARVAKEAERAKMTEDQKAAAELKDLQDSLMRQNRTLQLAKVGIDQKYLSLVSGSNAEEVEKNGALLAQLIAETKAKAEATLKTGLAQTGAPGQNTATGKVDAKSFYSNILGVK